MLQSANNALGTACVAAFTSAMRIKMFLSVLLKVWESLWRLIADKITEQVSRNVSGKGSKASGVMMLIYALLTFVVLMVGARTLALLFVDTTELEILKNTELFLHVSAYFFPFPDCFVSCVTPFRGRVYESGYAFRSFEMIARTTVSIYAVPVYGYIAVCFGDPTARLAADLFLIPAFIYVYRKLKELRCPVDGRLKG